VNARTSCCRALPRWTVASMMRPGAAASANDEDFDRVEEVRASCDAILVGATTIRQDNPRLLVRSQSRRAARVSRGESESPIKVTLTGRGNLDPDANFFTTGNVDKIVYAAGAAADKPRERLGNAAIVVDCGKPLDLQTMLADLAARGVRRLMVEGGGTIHCLACIGVLQSTTSVQPTSLASTAAACTEYGLIVGTTMTPSAVLDTSAPTECCSRAACDSM
jgi:hypothetical protein